MRMIGIAILLSYAIVAPAQEVTSDSGSEESLQWLEPYRAAAVERWEAEIRRLEERDASEPDPADAILLVGSSSIRLWETAARDLAPYRSINRGYGGAKFSDVAVYAKRLIEPHQYRGMVLFVANDISGSPHDHTPDEVERMVRHVLSVSQAHQPDAPVLIVEVTPTPSRFHVWDQTRQLNARLRELALTLPNVHLVATAEHYLDSNQQPIGEYFRSDALHQNEAGYELWGTLIHRRLDEVFQELAREQSTPHAADATAE